MPHFRINGDVETLKELSNFISSTYFGKVKVILWLASCYIAKKQLYQYKAVMVTIGSKALTAIMSKSNLQANLEH